MSIEVYREMEIPVFRVSFYWMRLDGSRSSNVSASIDSLLLLNWLGNFLIYSQNTPFSPQPSALGLVACPGLPYEALRNVWLQILGGPSPLDPSPNQKENLQLFLLYLCTIFYLTQLILLIKKTSGLYHLHWMSRG